MKAFYATLTNDDYHRVKKLIGSQSINQYMRGLINTELEELGEPLLTKPKLGYPFKTHCKRGHEFNLENTWYYKGWKMCRPCQKVRRQEHALRKLHNKVS